MLLSQNILQKHIQHQTQIIAPAGEQHDGQGMPPQSPLAQLPRTHVNLAPRTCCGPIFGLHVCYHAKKSFTLFRERRWNSMQQCGDICQDGPKVCIARPSFTICSNICQYNTVNRPAEPNTFACVSHTPVVTTTPFIPRHARPFLPTSIRNGS